MTEAPTAGRDMVWWTGLAGMLACLLAPLLVVDVPPLTDYPNHLARAYMLAFGARDPVLSQIFTIHWELIPNLGLDLLLPPLMHVLPPLVAGRVLVAIAIVLPVTGAIALSRACFGRLFLWQLCAGFVAFNAMLLVGLLNFQISIGVALWGAATWVWLASRRPALATASGIAFGLAAWICHLFGFAFYALMIVAFELAYAIENGLGRPGGRRGALVRAAAVAATLAAPVLLYVSTTLAGTGGITVWPTAGEKLGYLLVPVLAYSLSLARLTAALLGAVLVVWAVRGRLRLHRLGLIGVPVIVLLYAAAPSNAKGGALIDTRIPVMAALLLFSTTMPVRIGRREAIAAGAVLGGLFCARMAFIGSAWHSAQADITAVRTVLASVPAGSRVLTVEANPDQHHFNQRLPRSRFIGPELPTSYWHYGALAFLDRGAFWSDAFTIPGQQPIAAGPRYAASEGGGAARPPDYTQLAGWADPKRVTNTRFFLAGWPDKFDFVLLLDGEAAPDRASLLPDRLELVADRGFATLYRVRKSASVASSP